MEQNPADIGGMKAQDATAYIAGFVSTLKITEKQIAAFGEEAAKWHTRAELARQKGQPGLAQEAEQEAGSVEGKRLRLAGEADVLREQIDAMKKQLPLLAATERSIDPVLLEQELLIAAGHLPGDDEKVHASRLLSEIEKDAAAESSLAELKLKMSKEQL